MMSEADLLKLRQSMVTEQLEKRGITDTRVLEAMRKVPRHLFVPEASRAEAYDDRPLPLGPEQTISQPYIVALMLEELKLSPGDKVLDVGTGSGYQTALLAELAGEVYSMEIDQSLLKIAEANLKNTGYDTIHLRCGDGYEGWKEAAPFDAIILSASPDTVPRELIRELKLGGRFVLPVGRDSQMLVYFEKTRDGLISRDIGSVSFVPMKQPE